MVGQTQRPWIRQNPSSCLTQCQTEKKFSPTLRNIYKKQHGARPCVEKMQLIFFVPPNEELEGTLHPQKFGCTTKNEGTNGLVFRECKHIKNIFEDVYFTKNSFHITLIQV